ncbi:MAG: nitroreductase family deazaflavin-dependent oxidoreductase [Solirubrobacterales bacterium]|nr:nitroreductase family deazaflavin-dependent oxidoreductase [Solirubrobacterales bacterium]MCB0860527.1 nitroreductase family deazaflavin-dependent oxidoreductase [Solirubrobacterales bacterium]HRV61176.1 nitroreductase/quinone reductase family protein [Solirubrobacterales bacterium]
MRLPPVDPTEPPSLYKRAITPIALSSVGQWYLKGPAPVLDDRLFRWTRGRLTSVPGIPILLLKSVGAKSGRPRLNALGYFNDGERVIAMASNYGGTRNPAWYYNVRANPDVTLTAGGREGRYRAEITSGAERDRLWELAKGYIDAYEMYEGMTAGVREVPVIAFTPMDPE